MIEFKSKHENIVETINRNLGIVAVYGIKYVKPLIRQNDFYIDYFIDQKAIKLGENIEGKKLVTKENLANIIKRSERKATIIICISYMPSPIVHNIFEDLCSLDIDADVFDYFENDFIFFNKTFIFKKRKYKLFEHPFNCFYCNSRMTERSVEISLADEWIKNIDGEIVEIGAVTPYYYNYKNITSIIDPTDSHFKVTIRKSMFDVNLDKKNILSISTIEHIGTLDYGMNEQITAIDALNKILTSAKRYFITFPYGYNFLLDNWVNKNRDKVSILVRNVNNEWKELSMNSIIETEYLEHMYANGIVILSN